MLNITVGRRTRAVLRFAAFAAAFALPPVVAGAANVRRVVPHIAYGPSPAFAAPAETVPFDPEKPTAVVVMSNHGTELTDFLAPYELLSGTGAFNVLAVAPEARITPLGAGLDIVPHLSFDGYDQLVGAAPAVIVVPFINDWRGAVNRPVVEWIKAHAGPDTTLLTICGGAVTLAETGLADGRRITTYADFQSWVPGDYPRVQWVWNSRYVEDGNLVSSAGITNAVPATLRVVERLLGKPAALAAARKAGYAGVDQLEDPRFTPGPAKLAPTVLMMAYRFDKAEIGVALKDGVGEIDLAAMLDTYPRSGTAITRLVAPTRQIVRSRHGLFLVPRWDFATAPALDRVIVPGARPPVADAGLRRWARDQHGLDVEYLGDLGVAGALEPFAFDRTLADIARRESPAVARWAARGLEYTVAPAVLQGAGWPFGTALAPVALGALGLLAALGISRAAARPAAARHPSSGATSRALPQEA